MFAVIDEIHKFYCPCCYRELFTIKENAAIEYQNCRYCDNRLQYDHEKMVCKTVTSKNKPFANKNLEKSSIGQVVELVSKDSI